MKKTYRILMVVFFLTFILGCSKSCFKKEKILAPSEPSAKKFALISKWIPQTANGIVTLDVYRLSNSPFWNNLINLGKENIFKNIENAGLNTKSDIGMIVLVVDIDTLDKLKGPLMLVQGGFNQDLIVSRIKSQANKEGIKLTSQRYNDYKIYFEDDKNGIFGTPYAFTALGNGIIVFAKTNDIKWIIDNKSKDMKKLPSFIQNKDLNIPTWGKIIFSDDLRKTIPPPWNTIGNISFAADLNEELEAQIMATVIEGAETEPLKNTLEGFKALEAIQMLDNKDVLNTLDNVTITENENMVIVDIPKKAKIMNLIFTNKKESQKQ